MYVRAPATRVGARADFLWARVAVCGCSSWRDCVWAARTVLHACTGSCGPMSAQALRHGRIGENNSTYRSRMTSSDRQTVKRAGPSIYHSAYREASAKISCSAHSELRRDKLCCRNLRPRVNSSGKAHDPRRTMDEMLLTGRYLSAAPRGLRGGRAALRAGGRGQPADASPPF
eukprot:5832428-Pleurochrysis_carterae.AAC.1